MSSKEQIISDEAINKAWGNANFGNQSKREVLFDTVKKYALGYSTGYTAKCIANELGLAEGERITDLGYKYMIAYEQGISSLTE